MTARDAAPALTLTLGRCDEMRAEVVLRVEPARDASRIAISGTLTGPRRGRDTTLPVTARLLVEHLQQSHEPDERLAA